VEICLLGLIQAHAAVCECPFGVPSIFSLFLPVCFDVFEFYAFNLVLICYDLIIGEGSYSFVYFFSFVFLFLNLLVSLFLRKCRFVGNIHPQVTEPLLQEVFSSTGLVEGCKLIRKEKVNFLLSLLSLSEFSTTKTSSLLSLSIVYFFSLSDSVIYKSVLSCSHHMVSSTTMIVDQLHLL